MGLLQPRRGFRHDKCVDYVRLLDRDDNGRLSWSDFSGRAQLLAERLGLGVHSPAAVRLMAAQRALWELWADQVQLDANGGLPCDALVGWLYRLGGQGAPSSAELHREAVHALLEFVDQDGDGAIDAGEYALYLQVMRSDADPAAAFSHLDADGDGALALGDLELLYGQWLCSERREDPGNWLLTGRLPPAAAS